MANDCRRIKQPSSDKKFTSEWLGKVHGRHDAVMTIYVSETSSSYAVTASFSGQIYRIPH
jgi:hypothetical protein